MPKNTLRSLPIALILIAVAAALASRNNAEPDDPKSAV